MRIKHKVNVRIADDTDMYNLYFGFDDNLSETTIDTRTKNASGTINIGMGTNEDLVFGDVDDIQGIFIKVYQDVTIKFNGGTEEILIKKSTGASYAKFFAEMAITSVNISAPVDEDVIGSYCVWGD